jgi:hypothetical protein
VAALLADLLFNPGPDSIGRGSGRSTGYPTIQSRTGFNWPGQWPLHWLPYYSVQEGIQLARAVAALLADLLFDPGLDQ